MTLPPGPDNIERLPPRRVVTIGAAPIWARRSAIASAVCCQPAAIRSARLEEANGISVADPTADRRSWRRVGACASMLAQARLRTGPRVLSFTLEGRVVRTSMTCAVVLDGRNGRFTNRADERPADGCRPRAGADPGLILDPRGVGADEVHDPSSPGHGEDRRHAVRVVGRSQGADAALRRSRPTATTATPAKAPAICSRSTWQGNLLADLTLGEGTIYHPGGIDYDGTYIWVPVAEYRPNSRSIVYRVDPDTMKATEMLRVSPITSAPSSTIPTTTRCTASAGARAASIAGRSATTAR